MLFWAWKENLNLVGSQSGFRHLTRCLGKQTQPRDPHNVSTPLLPRKPTYTTGKLHRVVTAPEIHSPFQSIEAIATSRGKEFHRLLAQRVEEVRYSFWVYSDSPNSRFLGKELPSLRPPCPDPFSGVKKSLPPPKLSPLLRRELLWPPLSSAAVACKFPPFIQVSWE